MLNVSLKNFNDPSSSVVVVGALGFISVDQGLETWHCHHTVCLVSRKFVLGCLSSFSHVKWVKAEYCRDISLDSVGIGVIPFCALSKWQSSLKNLILSRYQLLSNSNLACFFFKIYFRNEPQVVSYLRGSIYWDVARRHSVVSIFAKRTKVFWIF